MAAPIFQVRLVLSALRKSSKVCLLSRCARPSSSYFTLPKRYFSEDGPKDVKPEAAGIELSHPKGRKKRVEGSSSSSSDSSESSSGSDTDSDVDPKMRTAVNDVAKSIEGDAEQIKSDLLSQLRNHQQQTQEKKMEQTPSTTLSDLMGGMKVSKRARTGRRGGHFRSRDSRDAHDGGASTSSRFRQAAPEEGGIMAGLRNEHLPRGQSRGQRWSGSETMNIRLFEGPNLGIFTGASSAEKLPVEEGASKFAQLERKQWEKEVTFPPENALQEQIRWTKEGRLWKFPIDNEQGMEEEAKVGFHEHVFLEAEIADFPRRGPVRHFMELVCVGLSKNPYLTVAEKKEHINWFRTYFENKKHILDEVLVEKESATQVEAS